MSRRTTTLVTLFLAIVAAVPAPRAHADDEPAAVPDEATRQARQHFDAAERLFALGRFTEALREYEAAFEAKPLPAFLFNIGQCHRNLGDYAAAIFSFRKYLHLASDAPNRDAVDDLIAELEVAQRRREARDAHASDAAVRRAPLRASRPFYGRWWFWTGVGVALAGAGVGAYVLTRDDDIPSTDLGNVVFSFQLP